MLAYSDKHTALVYNRTRCFILLSVWTWIKEDICHFEHKAWGLSLYCGFFILFVPEEHNDSVLDEVDDGELFGSL